MPDGDAYRPGDIWGSLDGKTVEIVNTDAEGRLVLADALAYARTLTPDLIVDNATLTGACVVALGHHLLGLVLERRRRRRASSTHAVKASGEPMWRMPLLEDLREGIKSDVADVKQTGDRWGGSITAALFLREFVGRRQVGPLRHRGARDRSSARRPGSAKGATGHGVLTFLALIERARAKQRHARARRASPAEARAARLARAIADFAMIEDGDRILVAVSGGKDSYTMLHLLRELQRSARRCASSCKVVNVDQGHPGYPGHLLREYMAREGYDFTMIEEDTYSIVTEKIPEGKTYCSLCSRLRRGHPLPRRARSSGATRSRSATTATTCSRRCFSTCSSPGSSRRCRRASWPTAGRTSSSARSSTAPRRTSARSPRLRRSPSCRATCAARRSTCSASR